jgi:FlaA1/EpsC-like NDP-sugar epimerase
MTSPGWLWLCERGCTPVQRLRAVKPTLTLRTTVFLAGDVLIWALALYGAYFLRFEGDIPASHLRRIPLMLFVFLPPKLLAQYLFRLYRVTWRLIGLTDLINVWKANTLGTVVAAMLLVFLRTVPGLEIIPRSVILLDYILSVGGIALFRYSRKLWDFYRGGMRRSRDGTSRVLLVGAGAAGERLANAMLDDSRRAHHLVGFIDDDPGKHGTFVHGLQVFGGREMIPDVVRQHDVDEVVVSIPSAASNTLRGIVEYARQSNARQIRILPGVHELLSGKVRLQDVRQVNLVDLLRRPAVHVEMDAIGSFLAGKRVLVTGAAGSIGSELVRQLTRFPCEEILALDTNESGLFDLQEAVAGLQAQVPVRALIGDIRDLHKIDWVFRELRPQVVFHAAAYKHVPLMESHTEEAARTNVLGTFVVAEASVRAGAEAFVLISTDKAVNPNNVMGATKRVAERVIQALSQRGRTRFLAVRFGNVLGSRGSLIPIIEEQIRHGGPVTLTHPDMRRYFMSISEAVLLVLQASLMQRQTGILVLDMGEPVRVVDLAVEMIRLSGLEPDKDVPFVFTGVRPGEKMEEELWEQGEELLPTPFEKIFEIKAHGAPNEITLRLALQELERLTRNMDTESIRALLSHLAASEGSVAMLPRVSAGSSGS